MTLHLCCTPCWQHKLASAPMLPERMGAVTKGTSLRCCVCTHPIQGVYMSFVHVEPPLFQRACEEKPHA